jgi:hypothetical protein
MLVDHLGHSVAQQNDVLVKGLDLPLQLDAVHQVNGHWNVFPTERIQEGILQKLAFIAHDMLRVQSVVVKPHLTTGRKSLWNCLPKPLALEGFD